MQAAEALCPELLAAARGGDTVWRAWLQQHAGAMALLLYCLEAARREASVESGFFDLDIQHGLIEALRGRSDLVVTGRNLSNGILSPRVTIDVDVLHTAETGAGGTDRFSMEMVLRGGDADTVHIFYSFKEDRPGLPEDLTLRAVRVETLPGTALQRSLPRPAKGTVGAIKRCVEWLLEEYPKARNKPRPLWQEEALGVISGLNKAGFEKAWEKASDALPDMKRKGRRPSGGANENKPGGDK